MRRQRLANVRSRGKALLFLTVVELCDSRLAACLGQQHAAVDRESCGGYPSL